MLDRIKLLSEFKTRTELLFPDYNAKTNRAYEIWKNIAKDPLFPQRANAARSSFLIPGWTGNLDDTYSINSLSEYVVLSVDGSQIYPDRNMPGSGCFLINTGSIFLKYGQSFVELSSQPTLMTPQDISYEGIPFSRELVDLTREEFEFKRCIELINQYKLNTYENHLCLFDGSLIFWHLESKTPEIKTIFLDTYLKYLNKLYETQTLIAGYISLPKSTELINLVKLGLCRFNIANCIECHKEHETFPCKEVDNIIDTQVLKMYLKPFERTTIFSSSSKITASYPSHLKPHFFYININKEIARIEVPAWIAFNTKHIDTICSIILDQSNKGSGYPVAIAEAHEQAVVKGPDREFFYHLVFKAGIEKNKQIILSQKSIKKRGMNM